MNDSMTRKNFPWSIILINIVIFEVATFVLQISAQTLMNYEIMPTDRSWYGNMSLSVIYWLPLQMIANLILAVRVAGENQKTMWAYLLSIVTLLCISPFLILMTTIGVIILLTSI